MALLDLQYMLGNLSFACLLAMVVWYWLKLTFSLNRSLAPVGTFGMATANLSLAGLLLARWVTSGHFPLSNLYESLLFLSWGFTAFHLIMGVTSRSDFFGIVTSPIALLTDAFASFSLPKEMQKTTALVPALQSNWLMMHVTVMMISYVALISGSLLALAFLVVNYYDKKALENVPLSSPDWEGGSSIEEGDSETFSSTSLQPQFVMVKGENCFMKQVLPRASESDALESDSCMPNQERLAVVAEKTRTNSVLPVIRMSFKSTSSSTPTYGDLVAEKSMDQMRHLVAIGQDGFTERVAIDPPPNSLANQPWSVASTAFSPFAQTLDNLSYRTLGLGFPLLTIGILSGAVWANEAWGSYWSWDPKETWALITWLVFAIYLHTRLNKGWRGNKPALIAVAGFFVVWICYLGVNLLGTGLHSYGWFQARG